MRDGLPHQSDNPLQGLFYIGVDLGKKRDYSVVAVLWENNDGVLRLVFLRQFRLGTDYTVVMGYLSQVLALVVAGAGNDGILERLEKAEAEIHKLQKQAAST